MVRTTRRRLVAAYPFLVLGGVVGADALAGEDFTLLAAYSVAPAMAAANERVRRVVAAGGVALVVCLAVALAAGTAGTFRALVAYATICGVTAAAAYAAVLRHRTELARDEARSALAELAPVVGVARQVVFEPVPASVGPVAVAASCTCAGHAVPIGGDLYGVAAYRGGVRMVIGDVQGKGLPAAGAATRVLGAFREAAPYVESLDQIGVRMERALRRGRDGDRFVTAVLVEYTEDGVLSVLNFGHLPPLVRAVGGGTRYAEPAAPGLPLGLGDLLDEGPGRSRLRLAAGDRVLLYTDGIVEARDGAGRFFPLADHAHLLDAPDYGDALADLRAAVERHTGAPSEDDAALVLFGPAAR
ncbi:PP2C family protein-serine/threonine phosphatase [Kitasatospora sp. NPDC096147]|uniref:PP2C family protein-serine/threonine phosphatase n=1 Tax=Kitasatospora sp. NPDC096147 TaxID=3364093 RepID=UPI0038294DD3